MVSTEDLIESIGWKEIQPGQEKEKTTLQEIFDLKKINIWRTWMQQSWDFVSIKLNDEGDFELVVDLKKEIPELELKYKISVLLTPVYAEGGIEDAIDKLTKKPDLFTSEIETLNHIRSIHRTYEKDSAAFWIYDFTAEVSEYKRKTAVKQIKFVIDDEDAIYFIRKFRELSRTILVLEKA